MEEIEMFRRLAALWLMAAVLPLGAAQIQGYLADWNCVKKIVKDGVEQTFKNHNNCSLQNNYKRQAYGLITDDKRFYRLDAVGNAHVRELLPQSRRRDQLYVIVTGELTGDVIKVTAMSLL
jgi:hypothetical protein